MLSLILKTKKKKKKSMIQLRGVLQNILRIDIKEISHKYHIVIIFTIINFKRESKVHQSSSLSQCLVCNENIRFVNTSICQSKFIEHSKHI